MGKMQRFSITFFLFVFSLGSFPASGQSSVPTSSTIFVDVDAAGANNGSSWNDAYTDLQDALEEAVASDQIWVAAGTYLPTMEAGVIFYVDKQATGNNDGSSWENAFNDLQPAIDAAIAGDQVWVAAGTYLPTMQQCGSGDRYLSFQLKNGVGVYGGFDPTTGDVGWEDRDWVANEVILSGDIGNQGDPSDNSYHVFCHPDGLYLTDGAVLDGFTIRDGNANGPSLESRGGGMRNSLSAPTLTNVIFINNVADLGGAMYSYSANPTLTNVIISNNSAQYGGGMYNWDADLTLTNAVIYNNSGGGMFNDSSNPKLTNVTFTGNTNDDPYYNWGGMWNGYNSNPKLTNCILWGDTPPEIFNVGYNDQPVVNYSDIQGGYWGSGNINVDPLFVDAPGGDLHLQQYSPAIDAGDNETPDLTAITTDLDGSPRFVDDPAVVDTGNGIAPIVDMGAYEFQLEDMTTTTTIVSDQPDPSVPDQPFTVMVKVTSMLGMPVGGVMVTVSDSAESCYADLVNGIGSCSLALSNPGSYTLVAEYDGDGFPSQSPPEVHVVVPVEGTVVYVDADASGANNGTSWGDAFTNLQPAMDAAASGNQVWVASGTYLPTVEHCEFGDPRNQSFQLKNGVGVYGGFDPSNGDSSWMDRDWEGNPAILSGDIGMPGDNSDNSYYVFCHPEGLNLDYTAILDGFTISGAQADENHHGSGMKNFYSSPKLIHLIFENNSGSIGGGMYNYYSSPSLSNVTFSNNTSIYSGGGMVNSSSSPTLNNVTFSNNIAAESGGGMVNYSFSVPVLNSVTFSGNIASAYAGGGMDNSDSSPKLTNVTFYGNSATGVGGGLNSSYYSSPRLINVIFSNNTASDGGGIYCGGNCSLKLTNVTFTNNAANNRGGGLYSMAYNYPPTLTNVTFSGNTADSGGGMYYAGSASILTNVTFSGNSASLSGGGLLNDITTAPPILTNCILWGNTPDQIFNHESNPTVTYSDIQGGYEGTGNIDTDPLLGPLEDNGGFVSTHALGSGSPAIDTGNPDPLSCPATDARGVARPQDGNGDGTALCDMGAYEFQAAGNLDAGARVDIHAGPSNDPYRTSAIHPNPSGDPESFDEVQAYPLAYGCTNGHGRYKFFQLKNGVAVYGGFDPSVGDVGWDDRDWVVNATILSGDIGIPGDSSDNSYHVFCHPEGLNLDNSAILDGFTIRDGNASNLLWPENTGAGMFNWSSSPTLANLIFSRNTSNGWGGGIYNNSSSPILVNVTFSENTARYGGGMCNQDDYELAIPYSIALDNVIFSGNIVSSSGGGIYNTSYQTQSSLTLDNVTFSNNSAGGSGGGLYNRYWGTQPTITLNHVLFSNNTAGGSGGGMQDNSSPGASLTDVTFTNNAAGESGGGLAGGGTLTNVTFAGNSAGGNGGGLSGGATLVNVTFSGNTGYWGGGMFIGGYSPTLTNVTFFGNVAESGGGMYNIQASPILTNSILWGDSPDEIFNNTSNPVVSYSDIQGGYAGIGNIDVDPLLGPLQDNGGFIWTRALSSGSPAIDAGNPDPTTCPPVDARGASRPIDGDEDGNALCDMGAFEYQTILLPTYLMIISDLPDPSLPNESFRVTYEVTSTFSIPTGVVTVTVSEASESCISELVDGIGSCSLVLSNPGNYTLTAEYSGDDFYLPSTSLGELHNVDTIKAYLAIIIK